MTYGCGNSATAGNREQGTGNRKTLWLFLAAVAATCLLMPLTISCGTPSAQEPSAPTNLPKLEDVLAGMDQAAAGFTSVAADLEYTKVTVIVNDRSTQTGKIFFEKSGGKTRVMIAFTQPAQKYVLFANGKVDFYQPKIAEVDEYELSQRQGLVEQFLLLGFGTPGAELQNAYQVSLKGAESVAGQQSYLLDLTPKSPKVAAQLQRIQLWILPQNWEPVQQKFFEPGGDYVIARYSNIKLNAKIPDKEFRLPLKGKFRTVRPQAP